MLVRLFPLVLLLGACYTSGRELQEPASTPPPPAVEAPATVGVPLVEEGLDGFSVGSDAFTPGGAIPAVHHAATGNTPPLLRVDKVPFGTVELALTVTDADADDAVHWVVTGIDPATSVIDGLPAGATEYTNATGALGWWGPASPPGETHRYRFEVYALALPIDPTVVGSSGTAAIAAIEEQSVARASIMGTA